MRLLLSLLFLVFVVAIQVEACFFPPCPEEKWFTTSRPTTPFDTRKTHKCTTDADCDYPLSEQVIPFCLRNGYCAYETSQLSR